MSEDRPRSLGHGVRETYRDALQRSQGADPRRDPWDTVPAGVKPWILLGVVVLLYLCSTLA